MIREEAIKIFLNRGWIEVEGGTYFDGDKWRESIVVISDYFRNEYKALEQEPSGDAINRQAVLDMLEDINAETEGVGFYYEHYVDYIKSLPPVNPQEPNITWVTGADGAKIAFGDVPVWKVTKICEILGEPQERSDKE